ncbi:MAG: Helix-hairpin-helix motif-containing protein [Candidatus Electronema aureum]|uniref:Helix-hairpin-helix motif-containing protein n=1 Tax=Candidatus Electronema aureum TaxID=2005002 RepID=A0A521G5N3_9BACT|nr:MAG: Helix-hairpin-helix motif-containing protein [Candidatus Electronema aureum]
MRRLQLNDHRPFVLILLAALILASDWYTPKLDAQVSAYFWAEGKLIRTQDSRAGQGVPLTAGMSCADIPPEIARFFNLPLPINRADQYALIALPGIGPKLAEKIITYREGKGGITGPDDLIEVNGIGPKRSASLLPLLCFDKAQ